MGSGLRVVSRWVLRFGLVWFGFGFSGTAALVGFENEDEDLGWGAGRIHLQFCTTIIMLLLMIRWMAEAGLPTS